MNFERLDHYLREYTDHEKDYLLSVHSGQKKIFRPLTNHLQLFDFKKTSRFLAVAEHTHDYIELNYVYSGSIIQIINDEEVQLKKGDLIILDTQVSHSIETPGENDILLAFRFSKEYFITTFFKDFKTDNPMSNFLIKSLFESQKYKRYLYFNIQEEEELETVIKLLVIEFLKQDHQSLNILHHYISIIFEKLIQHYEKNIPLDASSKSEKQTKLRFDILHYLDSHFDEVTLAQIAAHFNYSPNYFSNLVRKMFQKNFCQLLKEVRFKNALILLDNTSLSIAEICEQVGFSNQNIFYKLFNEKFHLTPKKYRQQKNHSTSNDVFSRR
jgi:AraC-like DNA-binding protein/mannose-6-phosphate isomerase-like protein (cupin superfamily)